LCSSNQFFFLYLPILITVFCVAENQTRYILQSLWLNLCGIFIHIFDTLLPPTMTVKHSCGLTNWRFYGILNRFLISSNQTCSCVHQINSFSYIYQS
jgi:hypothetical protein